MARREGGRHERGEGVGVSRSLVRVFGYAHLELPRPLRLATALRRNKLLPERSLLYQFPEIIGAMGRAALLRRRV